MGTEFDAVKDSGVREQFATGSRRDTRKGKGRFDLIPPCVLRRDARHYENGAVKYGDRNWEKGQPVSRYLDSAMRHINEYRDGDVSEDHLAAARWNIACIMFNEEMILRGRMDGALHDMPDYSERGAVAEKGDKSAHSL